MTIETIIEREIKRVEEQKKYYQGQIIDCDETIEWMKERLREKQNKKTGQE